MESLLRRFAVALRLPTPPPEASDGKPAATVPLRRLFAECATVKLHLVVPATLASLALSAVAMATPYYDGLIWDLLSQSAQQGCALEGLWPTLRRRGALSLLDLFCHVVAGTLFAMARWDLSMRRRKQFFAVLMQQDLPFYESAAAGELHSRLRSEPERLQELVNKTPERLLRGAIQSVSGLILMLRVDWRLALLAAALKTPVYFSLADVTSRVVARYSRLQHVAMAKADSIASEALLHAPTVQAFAAQESEAGRHSRAVDEYLGVIAATLLLETVLRYTRRLLELLADNALIVGGALRVCGGHLSLGQFLALRSHVGAFMSGFNTLCGLWHHITSLGITAQSHFETMERVPALPPTGLMPPTPCFGALELRDIVFRYGVGARSAALDGVCLDVPPGELTALCGKSGAGKSTILKLLLRFYAPEAGRVTLDGVELTRLDATWLRRQMGVVSQEVVIFDRSVRDNIAYGVDETASEERVVDAARRARCEAFVTALPAGYETILGVNGARLSGGQKQRLAIARALVREPTVLLLDEATSNLDAASECEVQRALGELTASRTTLVVAHRLATIQSAARIYVLDRGRVVEVGTHAELLAKQGIYADFVRHQALTGQP